MDVLPLGKSTYLQVRQPDRDLSLAWDNRPLDGILAGRRDQERFVRLTGELTMTNGELCSNYADIIIIHFSESIHRTGIKDITGYKQYKI